MRAFESGGAAKCWRVLEVVQRHVQAAARVGGGSAKCWGVLEMVQRCVQVLPAVRQSVGEWRQAA